jgi:uncharacterized membrane protein
MASQKRSRTASGQTKSGGTATRSGSVGNGSSGSGRGGGRTPQVTPVRTGKNARGGTGQGGSGQGGSGQGGSGQGGSGQGGSGQNGSGQNGGRGQGNRGQGNRGQGNRGQGNLGPGGRGPGGRPAQRRPAGPPRQAATDVTVAAVKAADDRFTVPAWVRWTSLVLSLAGLGVSIYLTIAHYTSTSILACSAKGFVDCAKVTTSSQSMVFGVLPVAVLGLAFYVFMVAVNSPWGWRFRIPLVWWARLGSVVVGIGFVLYLVYAEIIQIGNICLWCTSVHVITFLLFALLIFAASIRNIPETKPAR